MKKYGIVADTSCETTEKLSEKYGVAYASFRINVDDVSYIDDENLDLDVYIDHMNASPNPIKTACPSPGEYVVALQDVDAEEMFIITISGKLSGSYESAILAREMFLEKHPDRKIHVIDSKSAVAGESHVYIKLTELLDQGLEFEEIVDKITKIVDNSRTLFVLEDLSNLIKNGRIKKTAGLLANMLSIKPVMRVTDGEIELHELVRGTNKSLDKMVEAIGAFTKETLGKTIVVSHVRAPEKVERVVGNIKKLYEFSNIEILHARGLSSGYADDKGIVIAFEQ